ncbi:MAG: hypothetical protein WBO32_00375, partial [Cyclobacteriaceae bacterium]
MNTKKFLLGSIFLLTLSMVIWSCKDDFTAEDQLKLQAQLEQEAADAEAARQAAKDAADKSAAQEKDSVSLAIQVYNASITATSLGGRTSGVKGLTGITVALSTQGTVSTATTDADGLAIFLVQPGSMSGTLTGTGFATANFTISVDEEEDNEGQEGGERLTNASVTLPLFANTGATTARVSGPATFQGDLLNDTRESVPDGVTITFRPDQNDLRTYYINGSSNSADVDFYSFQGAFIATVTGGVYSIDLPVGADGLDYTRDLSDFTADQMIAINAFANSPNSDIRDVRTISTRFGPSVSGSGDAFGTIPFVSGVQVDIAAPPAAFTTAATATAPVLNASRVESFNGFTTVAQGTGYTVSSNTIPVTVTAVGGTPTTAAILYATSNAGGQITGILGNGVDPDGVGPLPASDYGAGYRGRSTLAIGGGGSGAIVIADFATTLSTITLTGGAGYALAPNMSVRGLDVNGNNVEANGSSTISGGVVVAIGAPGQSFQSISS